MIGNLSSAADWWRLLGGIVAVVCIYRIFMLAALYQRFFTMRRRVGDLPIMAPGLRWAQAYHSLVAIVVLFLGERQLDFALADDPPEFSWVLSPIPLVLAALTIVAGRFHATYRAQLQAAITEAEVQR